MRNCSKIHPLLSLEAEGALSASDHRKVEAHLSDCAEARRLLASLRRLQDAVRNLPAPKEPKNLHGSVMARLSQEGLSAPKRDWGMKPLWPMAAAAAATIFFFMQNPDWRQVTRKSPIPPVSAPALEKPKPQAFSAASMAKPAAATAQAPKTRETAKAFAPMPAPEERDAETLTTASNVPIQPMAAAPGINSMRAQSLDVMAAAKDLKAESPSSWNGDQDPLYTAPNQQVLTDSNGFLKIWEALEPNQPAPNVDFARQAVLFIETGEEPTSGYVAEILRVEFKPGQVSAYYRVEIPAGAVTAQVESHPWVLKIIPKPSDPVFFQQEP